METINKQQYYSMIYKLNLSDKDKRDIFYILFNSEVKEFLNINSNTKSSKKVVNYCVENRIFIGDLLLHEFKIAENLQGKENLLFLCRKNNNLLYIQKKEA